MAYYDDAAKLLDEISTAPEFVHVPYAGCVSQPSSGWAALPALAPV